MTVPKIIDTATVARVLGWPTHRARRWLKKSGASRKVGGRWVTTSANLMTCFPEVFQQVMLEREE